MQVAFSGGRELEASLRELGSLRQVKSALTRAGKRALQPIAEATRQRVPRDTEELAKGVEVRPLTRRQGGSAMRRTRSPITCACSMRRAISTRWT